MKYLKLFDGMIFAN